VQARQEIKSVLVECYVGLGKSGRVGEWVVLRVGVVVERRFENGDGDGDMMGEAEVVI
jgi:hypothetical protein